MFSCIILDFKKCVTWSFHWRHSSWHKHIFFQICFLRVLRAQNCISIVTDVYYGCASEDPTIPQLLCCSLAFALHFNTWEFIKYCLKKTTVYKTITIDHRNNIFSYITQFLKIRLSSDYFAHVNRSLRIYCWIVLWYRLYLVLFFFKQSIYSV